MSSTTLSSSIPSLTELCYQCLVRFNGKYFLETCLQGQYSWVPLSIVCEIFLRLKSALHSKLLFAAENICPDLRDLMENEDIDEVIGISNAIGIGNDINGSSNDIGIGNDVSSNHHITGSSNDNDNDIGIGDGDGCDGYEMDDKSNRISNKEMISNLWKDCFRREFPLFAHLMPKPLMITQLKLLGQQINIVADTIVSSLASTSPFATMNDNVARIDDNAASLSNSLVLHHPFKEPPMKASESIPWLEDMISILNRLPMTVGILQETMIGKSVNQLVKTIRPRASVADCAALPSSTVGFGSSSVNSVLSLASEVLSKWKWIAERAKAKDSTNSSTRPLSNVCSSSSSSAKVVTNADPTKRSSGVVPPKAITAMKQSTATPSADAGAKSGKASNVLSILDEAEFLGAFETCKSWRGLNRLVTAALDSRFEDMAQRVRNISQRYRDSRSQAMLVHTRANTDKRARVPVPIITRTMMNEAKRRKVLAQSDISIPQK